MSNNISSPVSFKGQLFVSTFKNGTENFVEHKISDAQFKLIKSVVDDFAPAGEVTAVKAQKLTFIYNYLKNILGIQENVSKLKTDKCVYNSFDNIRIYDKNANILNGSVLDFQV